tara:strand:- start:312 stop:1511 length:1200 start_codon:yes stop_codon:yes gene_type:complete
MTKTVNNKNLLNQPLILPCGEILKNRIVKSAMSDSLSDGEGSPTDAQIRLYEKWAEGGVALSIVGEVQIDPRFPENTGNLVLNNNANLQDLKLLTTRAKINGTHIWPQLGHAGGLSHSPISTPKGPSHLKIGDFECEGMSTQEVSALPNDFAKAALLAKEVGFTGVQIHAGHGFLLSQFLSPLFNRREDQYGGSIEARCKIIVDIIGKVRSIVGNSFPIGIKINCTDQLQGGLTEQDALIAIGILDKTSIDLIELSGGSYFPGAESSSDSLTKGPYFINFAAKSKKITNIPITVTGGFKTREEAINTLQTNSSDMVGIARALVLNPNLVNNWLNEVNDDPKFPRFKTPPEGGITAWYTMRINAIGNDTENHFDLDLPSALQAYKQRDKQRCIKWLAKFA